MSIQIDTTPLPRTILPEQRDQLRIVHDAYHGRNEEDRYSYAVAKSIGQILVRSRNGEHQFDAGWAFLEAAQLAPTGEVGELVDFAGQAWEKSLNRSRKVPDKLRVAAAMAFLPVFRDSLTDSSVNMRPTYNRLKELNAEVSRLAQKRSSREGLSGIATELGVLGVMAYDTMSLAKDDIAWPAPAHLDKHSINQKSANFDVAYGTLPTIRHKIQVKSFLDQEGIVDQLKTDDGDTILDYWRSLYDDDITLVFGDVHLWNDRNDAYFVNRLVSYGPSDARRYKLRVLAANVLNECANAPTKPTQG